MSKQQLTTKGQTKLLELGLTKKAVAVLAASLLALTGVVGVSQEVKANGAPSIACTSADEVPAADGDGIIKISTPGQLKRLSASQTSFRSSSTHILLTADIDLAADCLWTPLGAGANFEGVFDGGGFTVSNLYVSRDANQGDPGFFGAIKGGVVRNLTLTGSVSGVTKVGGLASEAWSSATITNVRSEVNVTGSGNLVGGLVGTVSGSFIERSSSAGDVTGAENVGGLVGSLSGSSIERSSSTANVTGTLQVGGLVGNLNGPLSASFSSGTVNGVRSVGGLVGFVLQSSGTIVNSYSTATATSPTPTFFNTVGGLVGFLADPAPVTNSWSRGAVTGADPGGLIAFADNPSTVNGSFWDTQTSGQTGSPGGGAAKTSAQMTSLSTFQTATWKIVSGWQAYDPSTRVWGICSEVNSGYPFLLWEYTTSPCASAPGDSASGASSGSVSAAPVVVPESAVTPRTVKKRSIRPAVGNKPARLLGRSLGQDVSFVADSTTLSPEAKKILRRAARLATASNGKVAVTGFAAVTARGSAYEKSVAQKRARVVARFLRAQGFDNWIYYHGLSGRQGQVFGGDPRRVEIRVLK
jgi:outer membrane protein OmpA-like peptidoglycan-associated protein